MPLKLYQRGKVWHYRGTVAGNRLRGSCKTADKPTAARQREVTAAEVEDIRDQYEGEPWHDVVVQDVP